GLRRHDVDGLASALGAEGDRPRRQGEEGVVLATADVVAGVELGAALTHEDLARVDGLPTETLDAESLGVGIAPVLGAGRVLLALHVRPVLKYPYLPGLT